MNHQETIRRYPRLTAALLSVASDTDVEWAADVIQAAKTTHSEMSVGLVREAWKKRRSRGKKNASRIVEMYAGYVLDVPSKPNFTLPRTG